MSTASRIHSAEDSSPGRVLGRIDEAICAFDDEWQITFVNDRAATILEQTPNELLGQEIWETVPSITETAVGEQLRDAISTGTPARFERYDNKFGRLFRVRIYPDAEGATVCFSDITGMTERVQELKETAQRLTTGLKQTDAGVWEIDPETGAVVWTESMASLISVDPDSFEGTVEAFLNYVHPEDRSTVGAAVDHAVENETGLNQEFRVIRADDTQRWVEIRAETVDLGVVLVD
ncbi:MAG: PAS sensor histidine kinase [uncultured archaeon A07HN63]|nr:MAG: PAS sensor histidine kinase [uncultured archaeon A07HN63]